MKKYQQFDANTLNIKLSVNRGGWRRCRRERGKERSGWKVASKEMGEKEEMKGTEAKQHSGGGGE